MSLPAEVDQVTKAFLSQADEALPGVIEGLYLHGSLGFGEWFHGRSDIDYVAVLSARPDEITVEAIKRIHAELAREFPLPPFDGFHITRDDLTRSPYGCPDVPCTQAGYFHDLARLDVHPVTWHELSRHGVVVRGPELHEIEIWTDNKVLRQYTHDNLRSYWQQEAGALQQFPDEAAKTDIVAWFVLGVSRLHHLLATNALTSKSGAGRYGLDVFAARWHPVIREALAVRETGDTTGEYDADPERRGRDTIAFARMAVQDGLSFTV